MPDIRDMLPPPPWEGLPIPRILRERKGPKEAKSIEYNVEVYTSEVLPIEVASGTGLHRDPQVEYRYTTYYYGPDFSLFQRDLQRLLKERTGISYLAVDAYYIRPSPEEEN